mmetsp:Transcript_80525/g.207268  ORF Transcript_80525/g.207268 Transcript_80525/m.207268 type:complete len:207 (-) Transcript_80525:292-912(-)
MIYGFISASAPVCWATSARVKSGRAPWAAFTSRRRGKRSSSDLAAAAAAVVPPLAAIAAAAAARAASVGPSSWRSSCCSSRSMASRALSFLSSPRSPISNSGRRCSLSQASLGKRPGILFQLLVASRPATARIGLQPSGLQATKSARSKTLPFRATQQSSRLLCFCTSDSGIPLTGPGLGLAPPIEAPLAWRVSFLLAFFRSSAFS